MSHDGIMNNSDLNSTDVLTSNDTKFHRIDHIAIAVRDLEAAIVFYTATLGFTLIRRLEIKGKQSGMLSAEIESNNIKFVLCQGTDPQSQVSKLVDNYGPGVAHVAIEVEDVQIAVDALSNKGLAFDTSVIGAGSALEQAFSSRDSNSGLVFEFIKRNDEKGFLESNVQELFDQLEKSGSY